MFDYYNKYNTIPSLLFSDWTYKILIERHGYILTKQEQRFLNDQYEAIINADLVIPMFQESLDKMRVDYSNANIHGINQNVINNLDDEEIKLDQLLEKKISSNYIVFIGRCAYKEGLEKLIKAVETLNMGIDIHVIGMTKGTIKDCPNFVKFHGYLRKDHSNENKKYYQLIREARLIANPTPQWSAYSSIVEGMYYYNPVIVYPFNQFIKEFGSKIDFGYYTTTASDLSNNIRKIFEMPEDEYCKIAKQAHEKVKNYTWDKYVDTIINLMSNTIDKKSKK